MRCKCDSIATVSYSIKDRLLRCGMTGRGSRDVQGMRIASYLGLVAGQTLRRTNVYWYHGSST